MLSIHDAITIFVIKFRGHFCMLSYRVIRIEKVAMCLKQLLKVAFFNNKIEIVFYRRWLLCKTAENCKQN